MNEYHAWVSKAFPLFSVQDKIWLDTVYQVANSLPGDDGVRFDTLGNTGPTALNQSGMATGIQQTAFNIFAECTFHCPAYWMAEVFSQDSCHAWMYQYSKLSNYHGADLSTLFRNSSAPNTVFEDAFQKIWGNFIRYNNPTISVTDATANYTNATVPTGRPGDKMMLWPEYSSGLQIDLNTTGGVVELVNITYDLSYYVREGSGIVNYFKLVNAVTWEGGRGKRCDFWDAVSERVPY
jgi:hypothetical protein